MAGPALLVSDDLDHIIDLVRGRTGAEPTVTRRLGTVRISSPDGGVVVKLSHGMSWVDTATDFRIAHQVSSFIDDRRSLRSALTLPWVVAAIAFGATNFVVLAALAYPAAGIPTMGDALVLLLPTILLTAVATAALMARNGSAVIVRGKRRQFTS